jgi:predicted alpha/beta-fold hydrolase
MYKAPGILFNRHLETIYPSLLRKVRLHPPEKERIVTPDDDFLDIDWYKHSPPAARCVIISHGLEGSSDRAYIKGMARAFFDQGFDVAAWNFRGCSGEVNRQLRFYHSGATEDLRTVIEHVAMSYRDISLVGFSLGGNLTLKYLGESPAHQNIKKAVAFSVPIDLHTSCLEIGRPGNWIYSRRFLRALKKKVKAKASIRKDLDARALHSVKTLMQFDDAFTGPLHGYKDAIDYYTQCSSIHFIDKIAVPTLVVNALNDPFLGKNCFPAEEFKGHPYVKFEFPENGGHVGFASFGRKRLYWSEMRALSFIQDK